MWALRMLTDVTSCFALWELTAEVPVDAASQGLSPLHLDHSETWSWIPVKRGGAPEPP